MKADYARHMGRTPKLRLSTAQLAALRQLAEGPVHSSTPGFRKATFNNLANKGLCRTDWSHKGCTVTITERGQRALREKGR